MLLGGLEVPLWAILSASALAITSMYFILKPNPYKNWPYPAPKSYPFIGSVLSYIGRAIPDVDMEWQKKYGKIILSYDGNTPNILISDPEFFREAFVKQFDKLTDRRPFYTGSQAFDSAMFTLSGDHWKHVRNTLSPAFSSGKLKQMMPLINTSCNTLVDVLKEKDGDPVEIRSVMSAYTLEVIASTAFGIEVNTQRDPNDKFMHYARAMVGQMEKTDKNLRDKLFDLWTLCLFMFVPASLQSWISRVTGIAFFDLEACEYLTDLCKKMVADSKGNHERNDFIHAVSNIIVDTSPNNPDTLYSSTGAAWSRKGLSEYDVIGNAVVFIFAGYTTTADTSHFLLYELALHPEIQEKARQEALTVCGKYDATYDQVAQLHYIEWCINETMRLYPVAARFDRKASADLRINGLNITKGTTLTVSTYSIHHDPEYWEKPKDFDPERWSTERSEGRHSCAFVPFGYGPRACIGMRLAQLEMKLAAVNLLRNFKICPSDTTLTRPPPLLPGFAFLPKDPFKLKLIPL